MSKPDKLAKFLSVVPCANWRGNMPPVWNEQLRRALSDGLVTVGWGGLLQLTDAGHAALRDPPPVSFRRIYDKMQRGKVSADERTRRI